MALMALIQESGAPDHAMTPFMTFVVPLFFAAIYLFGGRANQVFSAAALRRFHSFSSGCAISYVFVYIMPELHAIRVAHMESESDYIRRIFPGYSVYLSALLGFLVFYGLESLVAAPREETADKSEHSHGESPWIPRLHIGSFAVYTWLITFQIGRMGGSVVSLCFYSLAMGLHLAAIANRLRSEHRAVYESRGAILLALSSLAGWVSGLALDLPGLLVLDMTAIIAGGVIVNAAIAELPKQREASFWSFFFGAIAYTALLLAMSHSGGGGHP